MQHHLIDRLSSATIEAPQASFVSIQPISINRQTRMALFQHPNSKVKFDRMILGSDTQLKYGCGIKEVCWKRIKSPVIFDLRLVDQAGTTHNLNRTIIDTTTEAGQQWIDIQLSLKSFANQQVTFIFETSVADGADIAYCWAGWSDPTLEGLPQPIKRSPAVRTKCGTNVVVITSDALRADYLKCYGNTEVLTPNIDSLVDAGCVFINNRANTPTTLGSYATLLTGQSALVHKVLDEWSRIPDSIPTIADHFNAHGYQTVAAASEAEVADDPKGLTRTFSEVIPCLAVPAQSGDITARNFTRWLEDRPEKPFFAWVQFFDTHPPSTPPAPFDTMYYKGDPTDPRNSYLAEAIRGINGMESVLELEPALDELPQGKIDWAVIQRLRSTANCLTGKVDFGPDLSTHLIALGPESCRGLEPAEFGLWLQEQVVQLEDGKVTAQLMGWLHQVLPLLREIESDTTTWLAGLVDYRFVLAQYKGEVSFVDAQIGQIVKALKDEGIYDSTVVAITSPHGEVLGERDVFFHHHALMEEVLRVPLIIKPASPRFTSKKISGMSEQLDFLPTILDCAGLPPVPGLAGTSRYKNMSTGESIPDQYSFALDYHKAMAAVTDGKYVLLKTLAPFSVSKGWKWSRDEVAMFELTTPMSYDCNLITDLPAIAKELLGELDNFLAQDRTEIAASSFS